MVKLTSNTVTQNASAVKAELPAAQARKEAWKLLCEIQPACADLLEEAKQTRKEIGWCFSVASRLFYANFKPWVSALVGTNARNPHLRDSLIYGLLYEQICFALGIDDVCCASAFDELNAVQYAHAQVFGGLPDEVFNAQGYIVAPCNVTAEDDAASQQTPWQSCLSA